MSKNQIIHSSFGAEQQENKRQPSKAARKRVKEAFDPAVLKDICEREDFSAYATRYDLPDSRGGEPRFFYYKDNGAAILAVAHLDTVQDNRACSVVQTGSGWLAASGGLDDRLGAYVILDMLPKLGINVDILLTTGEEHGASTAKAFNDAWVKPPMPKQYNWIIEFDRGYADVVMYQYESKEMIELVENCGARVGTGSYSDIADLDDLGCVAFNWGVVYQDYHGARSHVWLEDTFRMVARFEKFHRANAESHLAYDWSAWGVWDDNDDYDFDSWITADCGHSVNVDDASTYIEPPDSIKVVCIKCGTMPDVFEAS